MAHHHGHHHHEEEQMLRQQAIWQWRSAMQAEYERLYPMPLPDLAAEIMARAFGPGGPGYNDDAITVGHSTTDRGPTILGISEAFVPDFDFGWEERGPEDRILRERIVKLIAEGLQMLEHASLVRCQIHYEMDAFDYAATRYGRAMLEQGQIQAVLRGR
jgi:hypothetical protein